MILPLRFPNSGIRAKRPRRCPLRARRQLAREALAGTMPVGATARGVATPVRPLRQQHLLQRRPPVGKAAANRAQHPACSATVATAAG
ncbi:hypothetical protein BHE74_00033029 [Ensete ventricosum]|nr:hypothetical protein BHE74_00033029 [Ensete ventricosum]